MSGIKSGYAQLRLQRGNVCDPGSACKPVPEARMGARNAIGCGSKHVFLQAQARYRVAPDFPAGRC